MQSRTRILAALMGIAAFAAASAGQAATIMGDLYYTLFTGGLNVNKVSYMYDETTMVFTLGVPVNVASTAGADGIIFAPNGNLLIGGQGSGNVYEVDPATGAVLSTTSTSTASFHLSLDPTGTKVYTSDFGGPLQTVGLPLTPAGFVTTGIIGAETGITQIAFDSTGSTFYVQGSPNGFGNVGHIDIGTGATARLFTSLRPAHGLVADSFTGLMTMFGAGFVGTFNSLAGSDALIVSSLKTFDTGICDFDQGALDGKGHALVAGCSGITFIDYHTSGDITAPDFVAFRGGFSGIDDVAPLSGLGSSTGVPEPSTLGLLAAALAGLTAARSRRRAR